MSKKSLQLVIDGGPLDAPVFGRFNTDITHDRVSGMSVNIPTKAFCPQMCILFVYIASCSIRGGADCLQDCHRRSPISRTK